MALPDQRLNCGFLLVTIAWSLALAAIGAHEVLLFLAPALMLSLPLALGRYLGEARLSELRGRLAGNARHRITARPAPPRVRCGPFMPRGGALIAAGLAKRPPPAFRLA